MLLVAAAAAYTAAGTYTKMSLVCCCGPACLLRATYYRTDGRDP